MSQTAALMFFAAGTAPTPGDGPTGPPTLPFAEQYSSPAKWRAGWTNFDPLSFTEFYTNTAENVFATATLRHTALPGDVSFDSSQGGTVLTYMWVRHKRNGQFSTEVAFTADPTEE